MQFFKRILKEEEPATTAAEVAREERRDRQRYAINPNFPLKAVLSFIGRDANGELLSTKRTGWDWKGRLVDFSEQGARMQLAPSASATRGDTCDLKLGLEGFDLVVPCHVTNIREVDGSIHYGLKHDITDEATATGYRQLLDIVALGATLKPQFKKPKPDESGYLVEQYASDQPSRLSIWRYQKDRAVAAFEFLLKDCLVRAAEGHRMEYLVGPNVAEARQASGLKTGEIHRLFHWVVPNLPPTVPPDVRAFLQGYA